MKFNIMRNRRMIFTVAFSRSKSIEDFRQTYGLARISSSTFNYSQGQARDNPGKSVQMTRKIAIVGKLFSLLCLSENTFVPRHAKSFYQFIRCNVGCNVEREEERERERKCVSNIYILFTDRYTCSFKFVSKSRAWKAQTPADKSNRY